jgi:hypothetical protein
MDKMTEAVWALTLSLAEKYQFNHVIVKSEMQFVGSDGNHFFFRDSRTQSPVIVDVKSCKAMLYRDEQSWPDFLFQFYQFTTQEYQAFLAKCQTVEEEIQTASLEELETTGVVWN